jgi:hypothetical protein
MFRTFTDREGHKWEVRPSSREEWELEPVAPNPNRARTVAAPGYETDPYELSQEELQRLLERSAPLPDRKKPSPFKD